MPLILADLYGTALVSIGETVTNRRLTRMALS